MPTQVFDEHHVLINLNQTPHRLENWRDGEHRDFTFQQNEIIVTPAGVESGWRWHAKSHCIVITLDPVSLEQFAKQELGILLTSAQLKDTPQFLDEDIASASKMLLDALEASIGSNIMFESLARVFLVKLIQKYGIEKAEDDPEFTPAFTAEQYQRVLQHISHHFAQEILLEDMAAQAAISTSHFSRLFKKTIGESPHQFVLSYRVERAKEMLLQKDTPIIDIALHCGFSDQAHFSKVFKQKSGMTPKQWRTAQRS